MDFLKSIKTENVRIDEKELEDFPEISEGFKTFVQNINNTMSERFNKVIEAIGEVGILESSRDEDWKDFFIHMKLRIDVEVEIIHNCLRINKEFITDNYTPNEISEVDGYTINDKIVWISGHMWIRIHDKSGILGYEIVDKICELNPSSGATVIPAMLRFTTYVDKVHEGLFERIDTEIERLENAEES